MSEELPHSETVFSRERKYWEQAFMIEVEKARNQELRARLAQRWPAYGAFLAARDKAELAGIDYYTRRHVNGRLLTAEEREKRHAAYIAATNEEWAAIHNIRREGVPEDAVDEYAETGWLSNLVTK